MPDTTTGIRLILAGGGKMGGAMLDGWIAHGTAPGEIAVIEPHPATADALKRHTGITVVDSLDRLPPGVRPEIVVFAVKPQMMGDVAPAYSRFTAAGSLFVSIAAGTTVAFFEKRLGKAAVVRCMPNLPASIHKGITGAFANAAVTPDQRRAAQGLLEAVGEVVWVADEGLIDAVTAVSGSGPAYVFLLAECLTQAARDAGLPEDLAARLARATIAGAGALLEQSPDSPETLRKNVTSPGGTTAAALAVLMAEKGVPDLMIEAVKAAQRRSRELAQS